MLSIHGIKWTQTSNNTEFTFIESNTAACCNKLVDRLAIVFMMFQGKLCEDLQAVIK